MKRKQKGLNIDPDIEVSFEYNMEHDSKNLVFDYINFEA